MIARLLVSSSSNQIKKEISKALSTHLTQGNANHPDLLYIEAKEKLGIAEAKKIKEYFSLKPYSAKGRMVVLENAAEITIEAQNALLKTIEELPKEAILIIGINSTANLLPTILSRCEIVSLQSENDDTSKNHSQYNEDVEKLLSSSIQERFGYIEKLKDKEGFLQTMIHYFHKLLQKNIEKSANKEIVRFLKELLQAEQWAKQNVNIRAILEYLMLKMPEAK